MYNASFQVPVAKNEPIKSYAPGSPERASLKAAVAQMATETVEVPLIIGGKEVHTGTVGKIVMPHDHGHVLGTFHQGSAARRRRGQVVQSSRTAMASNAVGTPRRDPAEGR